MFTQTFDNFLASSEIRIGKRLLTNKVAVRRRQRCERNLKNLNLNRKWETRSLWIFNWVSKNQRDEENKFVDVKSFGILCRICLFRHTHVPSSASNWLCSYLHAEMRIVQGNGNSTTTKGEKLSIQLSQWLNPFNLKWKSLQIPTAQHMSSHTARSPSHKQL